MARLLMELGQRQSTGNGQTCAEGITRKSYCSKSGAAAAYQR